ncbi:glycosyltransferase family 2 protein [Mucilaginibacter sp. OK098]|uniref:glycosyltransferase family 2 protein n=1 Tax=Mucilaginibacter sp. OK098 TaxID=1855297 RepID=UPI000914F428|nr:glycosyltransferase family 2 protein [Mucilaginibacter sp. OK098]SHM14796.1 Glycosyltransferase, GT2 family [Mucilaginibacter sp. OK098]
MKLSVIVVNRNTCLLLKQALNSLIDACKGIDYELLIVDNASADHSLEMLANNFPDIKVIANDTDLGVAKANNQALKQCTGEYILLVSPDTITVKDAVEKMITFMDDHADAGGMGIRMLSPLGRFLPESIHGLTKTWGTFLRIIGFAKHLSKTRLYDRHRKDWVEEFQVAEVDILNGACMMLRSTALNETGVFDERFFMYGADIDLSYRLRLAGFKNYYFPKTYIINFESHRPAKFSWNYVKYFYGAMFIFAVKYLIKVPDLVVKGVPQLFPSTYEVK